MKQTKITVDLKGLETLKKQLQNTYIARVGVLGASGTRTEKGSPMTNSEIALIQIFGSFSRNIPPRDFLMMPLETKRRELVKAMGSPVVKNAIEHGNYKKVFQYLGEEAERIVQTAFATRGFGNWAPNAPATVTSKGSDAPLIHTGQLRRAVTSDVVKKSDVSGASIGSINL